MAKLWDQDAFKQVTDKAKTNLAGTLNKGQQTAQQVAGGVAQGAKNFWNNMGSGGSGSASYQDGGKNARPTYTYENSDFQKVYNNIMNRKDFNFDLNGDALYQQYKDMYTKQGQLGMQDAMGQAAAAAGGYGSSYAAAAGQQAYQQSLENLNAHIPELYQMAMQKYQMEGDNLAQQYAMLADDRDFNYQRYRDDIADWESDRAYAYQQERDAVADSQWQQEFDQSGSHWQQEFDESRRRYNQDFAYQQERDLVGDNQWQQTFDRSVFENDRDYDRSVFESDRDYDRSVFESDRDFGETQRQFNAGYRLDKSRLSLENKKFAYDQKKDARDFAETQRQFNAGYRLDKSAQSLKNKEFAYQKKMDAHDYRYQNRRDQVADSQWQQTFDYGKQRDAVSDQHWAKEFGLSQEQFQQVKYEFEKEFGLKLTDQALQNWIAKDNSKLGWAQLAEEQRRNTLQYG